MLCIKLSQQLPCYMCCGTACSFWIAAVNFGGHGFVNVSWIMHAVKLMQSCYRFACTWLVSSSCMSDHCFCDTVNIEDL